MSKKKLFLHIGTGKTGTTALQNFFWINRARLAEDNIYYPDVGVVANAHHLLSPHHPPFLEQWDFLDVEDWAPKCVDVLQDNILISSELISSANADIVADFCKKLERWFEIKVVLYLRRQDDWVESGYNQAIKAGYQKRRISEVLEKNFDKYISRFDYRNILLPWADNVGKDNILIRPFEKKQFYHGSIFEDFLFHIFGVDLFRNYSFNVSRENPSLSIGALEFKYILNNLFSNIQEAQKYQNTLVDFSLYEKSYKGNDLPKNSVLSPQDRIKILDMLGSASEMVARDYLHRTDGKLFLSSIPDQNVLWKRYSLDKNKLIEIARFIKEDKPDLYDFLIFSIQNKLNSKNSEEAKAAKTLEPICQSDNRSSFRFIATRVKTMVNGLINRYR